MEHNFLLMWTEWIVLLWVFRFPPFGSRCEDSGPEPPTHAFEKLKIFGKCYLKTKNNTLCEQKQTLCEESHEKAHFWVYVASPGLSSMPGERDLFEACQAFISPWPTVARENPFSTEIPYPEKYSHSHTLVRLLFHPILSTSIVTPGHVRSVGKRTSGSLPTPSPLV